MQEQRGPITHCRPPSVRDGRADDGARARFAIAEYPRARVIGLRDQTCLVR